MKTLMVVNPNRSVWVTQAIDAMSAPHRSENLAIHCLTLEDGPVALSGYGDRAQVTLPLMKLVSQHPEADAFVIACFGDPGVLALKESVRQPVYGMGETSFNVAMSMGDRFGILSTGAPAIKRHLRTVRELGLEKRCAGDKAIGMTMASLPDDEALTLARMVEAGNQLIEQGADVLITGCAGMAPFRHRLATALGVPVIEPALASIGLAAANLRSEF